MKSFPNRLSRILAASHQDVGRVVQHGQALARIEAQLLQVLPANLRVHCHLANIKNGRLVLLADNASWASRLRFSEAQLLRRAQALWPDQITRLAVRTRTEPEPVVVTQRKANPISADTGQMLQNVATVTDDTELADALRRLAKHSQAKGRR